MPPSPTFVPPHPCYGDQLPQPPQILAAVNCPLLRRRYEDSRLARTVYQLHVRLLAGDGQTPLREFHHEGPEHGASREEKNWCHVRETLPSPPAGRGGGERGETAQGEGVTWIHSVWARSQSPGHDSLGKLRHTSASCKYYSCFPLGHGGSGLARAVVGAEPRGGDGEWG